MSFIYSQSFTNPASFVEIGLSDVEIIRLKEVSKNHHHHFICPIIQQYAHLREYDSRRAGQQGPIRTLTAYIFNI